MEYINLFLPKYTTGGAAGETPILTSKLVLEMLKQAPDTVLSNGGLYIRLGDKYFVDDQSGNSYRYPLEEQEWKDAYMKSLGYNPVIDDDFNYTGEYKQITNLDKANVAPRNTTVKMETGNKIFLNLSDREILDLMYDPNSAPEGTTAVFNSPNRGEGFSYTAKGDSIGTDGSLWKVKYYVYNSENDPNNAVVERQAKEVGGSGRSKYRKGTIPYRSGELDLAWRTLNVPSDLAGFWRLLEDGTFRKDE